MNKAVSMLKMSALYGISILPKEWFYSGELKKFYDFLSLSQYWGKNEILTYQMQQLKELVCYCYESIPYYHNLFDEHGLRPQDIKDTRDMKRIPLMDKEIAKKYQDRLIPKNLDKKRAKPAVTGGTTSTPLCFYHSTSLKEREKAFYRRMWNWHGYNGERCLVLRGDYNLGERLFSYNPSTNLITINTRGLDEQRMKEIMEVVHKYQPPFMQAYPSIAWLFARFINQKGLSGQINQFKMIFCASEKLFDFQKEEIERAFSCRVVDSYGHNERLVLMQKCSHNKLYHIIPEYGITEILDKQGNELTEDNSTGEIVGTGFHNYAFPLLRYRTGDYVTIADKSYVCKCGRSYRSVRKIDGRWGDFVITQSGKLYSPTVLEFAIDYIQNFKNVQLIQNDVRNLDAVIIPDVNFQMVDAFSFQNELVKRLNNEITVHIKLTDHIARPANQKNRFIISKVNIQN